MRLTEEDIVWWSQYDNVEITRQYNISYPTVTRTKKKYGIENHRKPGSGRRPSLKEIECVECGTTHRNKRFCSKECMYKSDLYWDTLNEGIQNKDKSFYQSEEFRSKMRKPDTPEYKVYSRRVHTLTKHVYNKYKNEINPNNHPRTLCGVDGGYQLDHIITIREGFDNNVPPEDIAKKENLRMLPWKTNLMRNYED